MYNMYNIIRIHTYHNTLIDIITQYKYIMIKNIQYTYVFYLLRLSLFIEFLQV